MIKIVNCPQTGAYNHVRVRFLWGEFEDCLSPLALAEWDLRTFTYSIIGNYWKELSGFPILVPRAATPEPLRIH